MATPPGSIIPFARSRLKQKNAIAKSPDSLADRVLQQKVVEMDRDKVTQILDMLQLEYEEELQEIREKFAVSVTGCFK